MILRIASLLVAVVALATFSKTSNAAFITFTNQAAFNTSVSGGLFVTATTNFDSVAIGNKTTSFASGGINFTGSSFNPPSDGITPVGLDLAVHSGTTSTAPNFLGINGGFGEFQGGSATVGDRVTLTVNPLSRAVGLQIITDTAPDFTHFARLSVGATTIDTLAGTGTALGGGFQSYFVGIVGQLPGDTFSTATVGFTGNFFRVDDVNIYAVPEPTSTALVGVAGLLGLVRRRARRV